MKKIAGNTEMHTFGHIIVRTPLRAVLWNDLSFASPAIDCIQVTTANHMRIDLDSTNNNTKIRKNARTMKVEDSLKALFGTRKLLEKKKILRKMIFSYLVSPWKI